MGEAPPSRPQLYCGLDIGSSASKGVLIDQSGALVVWAVLRTGVDFNALAHKLLGELLTRAQAKARAPGSPVDALPPLITHTVSTGYGRSNVAFADEGVTEITCQARACYHFFPRAITIVDVGGQDSKVIEVDARGQRSFFAINRKCAAGTGAFLEEMAARLEVELSDLNGLAGSAAEAVKLSSFCTVFAKSELLTHLRDGRSVEAIVLGVFNSVVKRIQEMLHGEGELVFTGGVAAHNPIIVKLLAEALDREVLVPPYPELSAAYGAALVAKDTD